MTRARFHLAWTSLSVLAVSNAAWAQRTVVDAAAPPSDTRTADTLLARRVTLDVRHVSRKYAIDAAAASARVLIQYQTQVLNAFAGDITLRLDGVSLATALDRILAGTTLRVVPDRSHRLVVVDDRDRIAAQHGATLSGRVTDSATKSPIVGAAVAVEGIAHVVKTDGRGDFVVNDVPTGEHRVTVRILGYRVTTRTVRMADTGRVIANFALTPAAMSLTDVVTTASGGQRRFEVGNSVTTLNVDSIRSQAPITSLTDVLDGRVPGLVVQRQSGAPGAPARVRLRGIRSIDASSDPIVVVDGVRVYSNQTDTDANAAYSVLDNLDVNTIASIDVLKGPSASALYGSDAANGVIVIKTKRGQAGHTRWTFTTDQQRTTQPGEFQTSYYRQGYPVLNFGIPQHCPITEGLDACQSDTLFVYNPLSDDRTSVLGTGYRQRYSGSVSGGAAGVQYSLTGAMSADQGLLKMSAADQAYVEQSTGKSVPSWQRQPQQNNTASGTARIDLQPMPSLTVGLTGMLTNDIRSTTPMDQALNIYLSSATPADTSLVTASIGDYRERQTYRSKTTLASVSAGWTKFSHWTINGDLGFQSNDRESNDIIRRGECDSCTGGNQLKNQGQFRAQRDNPNTASLNAYTRLRLPALGGIQLAPTIGANYVRTDLTSSRVDALGLVEGSSSVNGAEQVTVTEQTQRSVQVGTSLTLGVTAFDRIFGTVGTRIDASNALGANVAPSYPKVDLSYLLSEEPLFQRIAPAALSTVRLRMAYGHAAVQPDPGQASRTYHASQTSINGVLVPSQSLGGTGNSYLKPERSTELEWGFDLGMIRDRVTFTFNVFSDHTRDALTSLSRPPSLGGTTYLTNFGSVKNVGTELELSAVVVDRPDFNWSVNGSYANNKNRLTSLDPSFALSQVVFDSYALMLTGYGNRYVVGYPLDGVWRRPVVGYADLDGNGILTPNEIIRGDSSVFVGSPLPKYTTTFGTQLGLWHGFVTFAALFDYRHAISQANQAFLTNIGIPVTSTVRALNDPSASLEDQARALTGYAALTPASILRFQSLSLRVAAPSRWARRLGASAMSLALQGSNLGLWTNYSGADPDVTSSIVGNTISDNGVLPQPRTWGINVSLNY